MRWPYYLLLTILGSCVATQKVINIADAYDDPRFDRSYDAKTGYRTGSMLSVPKTCMDWQCQAPTPVTIPLRMPFNWRPILAALCTPFRLGARFSQ